MIIGIITIFVKKLHITLPEVESAYGKFYRRGCAQDPTG